MNIYIILSFTILLGLVVWGMIERKTLRGELAKERQEHINLIRTYETFRAYHEQYEKESIKWDAVDFVNHGEIVDIEITEESAQEYLESMIENHDCNIGITWNTVEEYLWKAVQNGDAVNLNV